MRVINISWVWMSHSFSSNSKIHQNAKLKGCLRDGVLPNTSNIQSSPPTGETLVAKIWNPEGNALGMCQKIMLGLLYKLHEATRTCTRRSIFRYCELVTF